MTDTAHPGTKTPAPEKTTLDIVDIFHILPHRFPFLLIDRVIEIQPRQRIVAIKNVTINEPFFAGHFPNLPIMPGRADRGSHRPGRRGAVAHRSGRPEGQAHHVHRNRAGKIPPAGGARQTSCASKSSSRTGAPARVWSRSVWREWFTLAPGAWPKPSSAASWWTPPAGVAGRMAPQRRTSRNKLPYGQTPAVKQYSADDPRRRLPHTFIPRPSSIPARKFIRPARSAPIA